MSIEALGQRNTNYRDDSDQSSKPVAQKTPDPQPKTPDFSGAVYASVHLPTCLIASAKAPSVSVATVAADARDLKTKADAVLKDLKSPEILEYVKSSAVLYAAFVNLNLTVGKVVYGAAELSEGNLLGLKELAEARNVPFEAKELYDAHREFAHANGPKTNEAFAKLGRDLMAMHESAIKLASDAKRIGGAP